MTTRIAVTFRAKKGREKEFNTLLNNPENGRLFDKLLGANRNTLFLGDGVMVRVIIPQGLTSSHWLSLFRKTQR